MASLLKIKKIGKRKGTAQNNNELKEPLASMMGIVRGDHLAVRTKLHLHQHLHHVLALEDITDPNKKSIDVIEYNHSLLRKVVKSKFSIKKDEIWFRIEDISLKSSDEIERAIKKAETQIDFKSYSQTCENTCENFIYWCFSETIYRHPVSNMYDIKRGDHIIQCGVFDRHMLAYEDGAPHRPLEVIQYSSEKVNKSEISFNPGKQSVLRVVYPENCMMDGIFNDANKAVVLRKAESQISFTKYSSERNNDEHFVNWCKTETGHKERVNKMSDIKLGDHIIYVGALSIDHHYLAVENGKESCDTIRVIQYKVNKVVEEDVKLSTSGSRLYRFVDDDNDLIHHDVKEIISQAKRQLGEKHYCDEANDNEHFVYWCKTRAEHRERISNLEQLRDGDHLIIRKYRGLKEHHSLVVENEFREKEIIYYDSNKVSKDRLSVDPSKQNVYRSYRNPYETAPLLRKEKFGQKARGEIGKSLYCIGNNENIHFVKWCTINTEIVEEVNEIDEIFADNLFILLNRTKDEHKLYLATGNGHNNKIDAICMSKYPQSQTTDQAVNVNPEDQIFLVPYCFEEHPSPDIMYNLESNMKSGQSVYGSLFVEMMHLMKPDLTRIKPVTRVADIKKADHLMRCRLGGLYYHHLLAVEDGSPGRKLKVIHFSNSKGGKLRIKIKEEEVEIDKKTGHYFIVLYDVCDAPDTVIKRARESIGQKGYSLESNNCEHFVTKCKIGSKQCDQLNYGGRRVLAALAGQSIDALKQQFLDAPLKTSAGVVAEAALLRIIIKAAAKGLNPTATGIRTVAASSGIAAGAAVLSEGAFLAHDAIKVERKINQVRNSHQEKHDIFTRQCQMGGAFVGGVGGTVGGGVIGQILIPVPVVGFAVGGVVGGFVGRLAAMGAGTGIGHVAYKPNGIDIYMDFLRSVRRNRILHQ